MKAHLLTAFASAAFLASGAALACDDLRMTDDTQASRMPEKPAVVAEKPAPAPTKKTTTVKQKTEPRPVAQTTTLVRAATQ